MNINHRNLARSALALLLVCAGAAHADGFIGATVTTTLFNPDIGDILGGPVVAIVGPGVEYPAGSILGNSLFQIDITNDQIIYRPLQTVTYGSGPFNGFVFDFSGAPDILGVTLDGSSNFTPAGSSFTSNSFNLNLSGNAVTADSVAVYDFTLQDRAAVPEPASWALMISGFGLAGAALRRRTRVAA